MKIELTLLHSILKENNENIFLQLNEDIFLFEQSKELFTTIRNYYVKYGKLPDVDTIKLQYDTNIFEQIFSITDILFLYQYVINRYRKNYYLSKLYDILEEEELSDILLKNQELLLELVAQEDSKEEVSVTTFNQDEDSSLTYPLGLGMFDKVLGGMSNSEAFVVAGIRGTGKSLILLNIALNNFINNKETTLFFSIEMRGKEVKNRIDSILTGIDSLRIKKNELSNIEKLTILTKRAETFKDYNGELENVTNVKQAVDIYNKLPEKKHRFVLLDTPGLTTSKIIYYLKKYPTTGMVVVDYLNILKSLTKESQLNWQVQIEKSNDLKNIARQFDVKMLSAVQLDEEGKIRFSKGIGDALDYLYAFTKGDNGILHFSPYKIRNGIPVEFTMRFNNLKLEEIE